MEIRYRPDIDGLRAIAVMSVILSHAGFEQFSAGIIGVDIFFVISGFLITGIIVGQQEKGAVYDFKLLRTTRAQNSPSAVLRTSRNDDRWVGTAAAVGTDALGPVDRISSNIQFQYLLQYNDRLLQRCR